MQDGYMGTVLLAAFSRVPQNWALCNGEELQIISNPALFSLIGTTYGGDGITKFCLPNLNADGLQPGMQYLICVNGIYPSFG